jgi:hypothetical protein
MKLIGRKLVMNWGNGKVVAIEILSSAETLYSPTDKEPQLYEIYEALGERIEKPIGSPAMPQRTYGQEIGNLMPTMCPEVWHTLSEYEAKHPKREE